MNDEAINFGPVRNARVFEEICDQVRDQLSRGKIRTGDKLPAERILAMQFRVSRAAVREALRTLEVSGLVELRKGAKGGAFVLEESAPLTQSFESLLELGRIPLRDVTEARVLITDIVVRLACVRGTKRHFDAIARSIDELEKSMARNEGYERLHHITDFYDLLAAASDNEMLRLLTFAIAQLLSRLIAAKRPAPMKDLAQRRRAILAALRARDADKAAKLLSEHLIRVHGRLER